MKIRILFLFFIAITHFSFGQKNNFVLDSNIISKLDSNDKLLFDSLFLEYHNEKNDTAKINTLYSLAKQIRNPTCHFKLLDRLNQDIKEKIKSEKLSKKELSFYWLIMAHVYRFKGLYYEMEKGEQKKSHDYYLHSFRFSKKSNGLGRKKLLIDLSNVYSARLVSIGKMKESIDLSMQTYEAADFINYSFGKINAAINLGNTYYFQDDLQEAIKYYTIAEEQSRKIKNYKYESTALSNKGGVYIIMGDNEKALYCLKRSDSIKGYLCSNPNYSSINTGYFHVEMGNYNDAFACFYSIYNDPNRRSVEKDIEKDVEKDVEIALAYAYSLIGELDSTKHYATIAYDYYLKTNDYIQLEKASFLMRDYYVNVKDWEKAFEIQKKYYGYRDSLVSESNKMHLQQVSLNHKFEKKEKQLKFEQQLKNLENKKEQKIQKIIIISSIGLLFIVVVFLYFLYDRLKFIKGQNEIINEYSKGLEEKSIELQIANEEIKVKSRHKEEFLANMSHEIRTPLNAILGYSRLTLKYPLVKQQEKYMNTVIDASENLMVVINDILDYAKIEAGKIVLENNTFALKQTLIKVYSILKLSAEEKGLNFTLEIDKKAPEYVRGDSVRLQQILINLVNNGIKFTSEGEVNILLNVKKKQGETYKLQFMVKDTGIGIPLEKQQLIFEKFNQLDSTTTREYGGTGLGLAISYNLVKLHGGELEVESEEGTGTSFYFTIDYYKSEKAEQVEPKKRNNKGKKNLKGMRVLVVDDNKINRMMLIDQFESSVDDIIVNTAEDGKVAIDKLKAEQYDVVLMDLHMPNMDGIQATKYIRKELKSDVVIIALTASVLESSKEECLAAGMNDFLFKPFRLNELLSILSDHMQVSFDSSQQEVDRKQAKPNESFYYFNPEKINEVASTSDRRIKMAKLILNDVDENITLLNKQLDSPDWALIFETIHKITNNAIHIGNKSFTQLSTDMEMLCHHNMKNSIPKPINTKELEEMWLLIKEELQYYIVKDSE